MSGAVQNSWLLAKLESPESANRSQVQAFVTTPEFRALRTKQAQYLSLVALLSDLSCDGVKFVEIAEAVRGRNRRYFSLKPETIEKAGEGAKAMRIRHRHPLYADVNNSTATKQYILRKLMTHLGYGKDDISAAVAALE